MKLYKIPPKYSFIISIAFLPLSILITLEEFKPFRFIFLLAVVYIVFSGINVFNLTKTEKRCKNLSVIFSIVIILFMLLMSSVGE